MPSLPPDILHLIVTSLDKDWRGVAQHINKGFADAVRSVEQQHHGARCPVSVAAICPFRDLLQWARDLGCPWDSRLLALVAGNGSLADLQDAASLGGGTLTAEVFRSAAGSGSLDVLRWLHKVGCPWGPEATAAAARNGRLEALQWLRANRCPWNIMTIVSAAQAGHIRVLDWAVTNRCPNREPYTVACAARAGQLEVLKWARARGWTFTKFSCEQAARGGHLRILQWLREDAGCAWDSQTVTAAAEVGALEVLQWARANGCDWCEHACASAAENGRLEALEALRAAGCPWDESTTSAAARGGHLEVLVWAHSRGCPLDTRRAGMACLSRSHTHVYNWLRGVGIAAF